MICVTADIFTAGHSEAVENVISFVKTGKPNTPVNLKEIEQRA
jgi:hypothetical protein